MNWDAIGAIGEVIGAVAVVATLIYLSLQIRQNTRVSRSMTRTAVSESAQALANDILHTPDMADTFLRHLNGEELSPTEVLKLQARCYRDMRHWENIFYQVREGLLSKDEWLGFRKNLAMLFDIPVYQDYWARESELYSAPFRKEIDELRSEGRRRNDKGNPFWDLTGSSGP